MKRLAALLCSAALVFLLGGCAGSGGSEDTIELWHWMTDRQDALETLALKYEQQTGIHVKLVLFAPSDAYTQKIIAAAQANVLPDIYGILDEKIIAASFIKAGLVADLTSWFEADDNAWGKTLFPRAIDVNRFAAGNIEGVKPGIYGVPLDIGSVQMVYNKNLLKKAGIAHVPATFDEWLAAIDALKRVGVVPFVTGFGELWIVDCFASNYAFNVMGEAKVFETFRGKVPYTDPDWIRVFSVFKVLRDRGAFIEGIVTKGNKLAEQDFALERAAFTFNGAWCVNVYSKMNPTLDYGVAPLPVLNGARPMISWGGAETSLVVNNMSARRDKAVAFLKWMTAAPQQVFLADELHQLPVNRAAMSEMPKDLAGFAKAVETSTHPKTWPVSEDPLVSEAFDRGIQAIIIGERTPQQVAAEVQRVKVQQMKRTRRP